MKIAVVTSRFPWPIEKGDKLRIFHQLKSLSQQHEILLISVVDQAPSATDLEILKQYCVRIDYHTIARSARLVSAIRAWANSQPAQVGYFYSSSVKSQIYRSIIDFQPDRIYCQLIRVSEYVKTLPFIKILDYMDTFSSGMVRQAIVRSWPQKLFYKREAALTKRYERDVYSYFDETTIISERDRDELPLLSRNLVHVVANGIDTNYFHPIDQETDIDILFVGNLGYKPNEQAVFQLLEWCRASDFVRQPKVLIAGARPTSALLAIEEEGWEIAGWVDDIRDAYRRARIFAAPLTTGSGLQNKLLEAMACGIPCITTNLVNDSIRAQSGVEVLIADNAAEFNQHVNELMVEEGNRLRIGENARKFVLNNYQWSEFNSKLEEIIIHAKSKAGIGRDAIS